MWLSMLSKNPYKKSFFAHEDSSELVLTSIKIYGFALPLNSLCIVILHTVINLFWYLSEMNRCGTLHYHFHHSSIKKVTDPISVSIANQWWRDEDTSTAATKRNSWSPAALLSCASTAVNEFSARMSETFTVRITCRGRKRFSFSAILLFTAELSPALSIALSVWGIMHSQLPHRCSNSLIEKNEKHISTDTLRGWTIAKQPNAPIQDRNVSTLFNLFWRWNSTFRTSIASNSLKGSKGIDPAAKLKSCRLEERGPDRPRITTQTWSSTRGLNSHMRSWMRRRSCVANTALKHRSLLRSARNVHLHPIHPPQTRLQISQRRRRRLYALTYSTNLTLASTTSKRFSFTALVVAIFYHIAYLSTIFAGISWSCSLYCVRRQSCIAVFSVSWPVIFGCFMWGGRKSRVSSGSYMQSRLYGVRIRDQSISIILSFLADNQCKVRLIRSPVDLPFVLDRLFFWWTAGSLLLLHRSSRNILPHFWSPQAPFLIPHPLHLGHPGPPRKVIPGDYKGDGEPAVDQKGSKLYWASWENGSRRPLPRNPAADSGGYEQNWDWNDSRNAALTLISSQQSDAQRKSTSIPLMTILQWTVSISRTIAPPAFNTAAWFYLFVHMHISIAAFIGTDAVKIQYTE